MALQPSSRPCLGSSAAQPGPYAHCVPKPPTLLGSLAPAPFPQQLHYYAGQTAAWANQRTGIPSPFHCDFAKGARGSVDLFPSPSLRCASGASSPQTVLPNAPGDPRLPPSGLLAGPVPLYVFHCPSHTCLARFSSLSQFLSTLPPSFFSSSAQSLALLFPSRTSSFWPVIFFLPASALHRRAKSVAAHTRTCTHTSFTRQG